MRSEMGRGRQLLTVGLGGAAGHGCVALSDQGRIVGVCEQERITRVRNAGFNPSGLPDEALDALLAWRQLTRDSLGRYAAAEPAPTAGQPPIAQIDHHLGHAATAYLSSAFPAATIVICDRDDPGVSVWTGANGTVTRVDWPWTGPGLAELYGQCAELFGIDSAGDERRFESLARLAPDSHEDTLDALFDSDGHSLMVTPGWRASVAARLSGSGGNVVKDDAPVAAALQRRIGDLVVSLVAAVRRHAGGNCLCLGGSLFYHSSINTLVARSGLFEHVFVPIDPGNGGLAVGTALHVDGSTPRAVSPFLGPSYSSSEIKATLDNCKLAYNWESEEGAIAAAVGALKNGLMVGWFDGGMEWGPRALGARCILANPFAPYVLENLNQFLKHRESWRGYGLSGLEQAVGAHFDGPPRSSFMAYDYRPLEPGRFAHVLPSPTAVVRLQTVGAEAPPRFTRLLEVFGAATGLPFLVNTSFNGFREPIVCNPRDAVRVFYGTGIDVLVAAPSLSATKNYQVASSASYVTGSHSFKSGFTYLWGNRTRSWPAPNAADIAQLRFLNGQPAQVAVRNTPIDESIEKLNADFGVFAQDAWTLSRVTFNIGARYDYFNAEVPAVSAPASQWVAARQRPAVENVPNWKNWSMRLAASWDVFGNGKTAVKANAGKYLASAALGYAELFNTLTVQSEVRSWVDLDGNRSVLDAAGNLQRSEVIGGTANFGQASGTIRPDPDLQRESNWEYGVSVQQEIMERVAVTAGYHRRAFGNLAITDNLNLGVNDWTPFTITAPLDSRLPNGGGYPIEMYTLNPAKVGTPSDNVRTYSDLNSRIYNGLDVVLTARLGGGGVLLGGVTFDDLATSNCDQRDDPNQLRFCEPSSPYRTIFKLSGSYPLPYDVQLSGSFTARPGADIQATLPVTAAVAGRPIIGSTAGATQINVNLIERNTMFREYINNLDLRLAKSFRFGGRYKLQAMVDFYNVLNAGTVTVLSEAFGANPATRVWMNPQALQNSRYLRFGAQFSF